MRNPAGISSGMSWRITLLLTCTQAMAFFHRTLITLFAEPIKLEFAVSDTMIGILIGSAFSVSFVVAALPISELANRFDRFRLLGLSIAVWSLLTTLSSVAANFFWLLACRMGIAAAMSGVTPMAGSIIADIFSRESLAKPMGLYASGIHFGVGFAIFGGAILAYYIDPYQAFDVGLLGQLSGWKLIFLITGLPGLFLAIVLLAMRDRPRTSAGSPKDRHLLSVFSHLRSKPRAVATLIIGLAVLVLVSSAIGAWLPTHFVRRFGWSPNEIGLYFGPIIVASGFLAAAISGFAVGWARSLTRKDPHLVVLILAAVTALPVSSMMTLMPSPLLCLALFLVRSVLGGILIAVCYALILAASPSFQRSRVTAVAGICLNIIGGGFGPLAVALVTDFAFGDPAALAQSLALVAAGGSALGLLILLSVRLPIGRNGTAA